MARGRRYNIRLFVEFLLKQGIYLQLMPELKIIKDKEGSVHLLNWNSKWEVYHSFILDCFCWSDTKEGVSFWADMDNQWEQCRVKMCCGDGKDKEHKF